MPPKQVVDHHDLPISRMEMLEFSSTARTVSSDLNSIVAPFHGRRNDEYAHELHPKYLSFTTGWYNIRAAHGVWKGSNIIKIDDGGGAVAITIPTGNYSATDLASELQSQIRTNATGLTGYATWSVSYSVVTNKFTITSSSPTITGLSVPSTEHASVNLMTMMGFTGSEATATTVTSTNPADLRRYHNVRLVVSQVQGMSNDYAVDGQSSFVCSAPVTMPFGGQNTWQYHEIRFILHSRMSTDMTLQLQDERGIPIDLEFGQWAFKTQCLYSHDSHYIS